MKILFIIPRVIRRYLSQFPEVTNNAYKYFNYDNRIVNERVDRGDCPSRYIGPGEFKDTDYDKLVIYAKTLINPVLQRYSPMVAAEDALHMAIRTYAGGLFDGKVNANKFNVLLKAMVDSTPVAQMQLWSPIVAAKREKKHRPDPLKILSPHILRELGLSTRSLPTRKRLTAPALIRERGKAVIK